MANILGTRPRGNIFYADGLSAVGAFGKDVVEYFQDFVGASVASDAIAGWTTTLVEAGIGESTVALADGSGGILLITTDANEDDGVSLQKVGEAFKLSSAQSYLYFGIRLKISDATQSDFFVGLAITDTTPLGGVTDGVYFQKDDGAATFKTTTEKDSTETNSAAAGTIVADTYTLLEFVYTYGTAGRVKFYQDGVLVGNHTANIPDDEELTPTIQFLAGAAAVKTMSVDYVRVIQIGR